MNLFIAVLVLAFITAIGCTENLKYYLDSDTSRKEFVRLLEDGFSYNPYDENKHVFGLSHNRTSCIYGETPNTVAKEHIDKLYQLFRNEFHIYDKLFYVKEFTSCPSETSVYIQLHEHKNYDALWSDLSRLLSYRGVAKKEAIKAAMNAIDPIAFVFKSISDDNRSEDITMANRREKVFSIVSIDQVSQQVKNNILMKDYLKMVITEELYQAFTSGKDLHKSNSKSILEGLESPLSQRQHLKFIHHNPKMVRKFMNANANGMCTYDLWFLILARGFDKPLYLLDDYKERFYEKYEEIKIRANEIINNTEYKDLFDSRCTGKNVGFSTAIPKLIDEPDLPDEFKKTIPFKLNNGLNLVESEKRCESCDPWRYIKFHSNRGNQPPIKTIKVTVQEGYRAMYAYPSTEDFAVTKIEKSSRGKYEQDKKKVIEAITHEYNRKKELIANTFIKNPDVKSNLEPFKPKGKDYISFEKETINGYEYVSYTENIIQLTGDTISQAHIFVPEQEIIITAYLLAKGKTKFNNIEEFLQLKKEFIENYTHFIKGNNTDNL